MTVVAVGFGRDGAPAAAVLTGSQGHSNRSSAAGYTAAERNYRPTTDLIALSGRAAAGPGRLRQQGPLILAPKSIPVDTVDAAADEAAGRAGARQPMRPARPCRPPTPKTPTARRRAPRTGPRAEAGRRKPMAESVHGASPYGSAMHGAGNDFVVLDLSGDVRQNPRRSCAGRWPIAMPARCDQILTVEDAQAATPSPATAFWMPTARRRAVRQRCALHRRLAGA